MSDQDRAFWLLVRRALMMIVKAIDARFLAVPPAYQADCYSMGEWKDT